MPAKLSNNNFFSKTINQILSNENKQAVFYELIKLLLKKGNLGVSILNDIECKDILIEKRISELPHWILSVADSRPDLVKIFLLDNEYRNTLNPEEFTYVERNYSQIGDFIRTNSIECPLGLDLQNQQLSMQSRSSSDLN